MILFLNWFLSETSDILDFLKSLGAWIVSGLAVVGTGVAAVFAYLKDRNQKLEEQNSSLLIETDLLREKNEQLAVKIAKLERETKLIRKEEDNVSTENKESS